MPESISPHSTTFLNISLKFSFCFIKKQSTFDDASHNHSFTYSQHLCSFTGIPRYILIHLHSPQHPLTYIHTHSEANLMQHVSSFIRLILIRVHSSGPSTFSVDLIFWWSTFLIICKHTDGFMHIIDLRSFDLRSHSDVTFMLIFSSCVKRSHLRTYRSKHAGGQYQCMTVRWEPK